MERLKLTKFIFSHLLQVNYSNQKEKLEKILEEINNEIKNCCENDKLSPHKNHTDLDNLILRSDQILKKNKIVDVNKWILKIFLSQRKIKTNGFCLAWMLFCF